MHPSAVQSSQFEREFAVITRFNAIMQVSVANGLVMGWVRFVEAGRKFDCINSLCTAIPIPVYVEEVTDIVSVAKYILIVEKESVFQRLANDNFCDTNRCIVITGRGYPDIPTRRFLRLLIEKLRLPVYCLVDCDPYGFDILTTYRFGSMQMAYDAKFLRVEGIHWLGAFPSDVGRYDIPQQCLLPLTTEDKRRTEKMLLRCYLEKQVPEWRWELEMMLLRGEKFEIEALAVHSLSFLSQQYIPSKIQGGLHL
ncbi:Meiotic recombination protein SPO11-1 [Linum grandiflorum]